MKHRNLHKIFLVVVVTLMALVALPVSTRQRPVMEYSPAIRCAVDLGEAPGGVNTRLSCALLRKFADDLHLDADIRVRDGDASYLDSLREGRIDLVVTFLSDSLDAEAVSRPFEDSTVWVLREGHPGALKMVNAWITGMSESDYFRKLSDSFRKGKVNSLTSISPYDGLIRKRAEEMGWDWRLLSSMIWHESRFTIDANSTRGAVGLMQIRSGRYCADTLLDPAFNIAVGTAYLSRLQDMFYAHAADTTECLKFALAAYNAGEGNILRCIRYAEAHGVDASRWDNVVEVLPDVPGFSGKQTVAYVDGVLDTYAEYVTVYPR